MTRVRIPLPICFTYCPHPPRWEKPWVTPEVYLSSLSCVLVNFNIATFWSSGITTVGWRKMELGKDWIQIFDTKWWQTHDSSKEGVWEEREEDPDFTEWCHVLCLSPFYIHAIWSNSVNNIWTCLHVNSFVTTYQFWWPVWQHCCSHCSWWPQYWLCALHCKAEWLEHLLHWWWVD